MNPTFQRWSERALVWLPERGMGFLSVTDAPYDEAYMEKYRRYAETDMGRAITEARCRLVRRHAPGALVCDVGIGCGAFVEAYGCVGYDVNPAGERWLLDRSRWLNPYLTPVDAVTFWDVIEHVRDPSPLLANVREWVFCSLPIVPGDGPPPKGWKHYRPDEHTLYFTRAGFLAFMAEHGFRCVEANAMETLLGRQDIESFAFRRA